MLYLRIENFISHTLGSVVIEKNIMEEEVDREEILKEVLPVGSMMREFYELGKRYYVPEEIVELEDEQLVEDKGLCQVEGFVEHTLRMIQEKKI